jgi:valyl-tRNA synthetase
MDSDRRALLDERTRYDAGAVESRIFAAWQDAHAFDAEPDAPGEPYCICLPPPNVTGSLHMGHALNGAVQDLLIRLKRMQGRNVLWQPGTDHAGIATQMVVERQLATEGTSRHDLGRDAFVERVWAWREATGSTIIEQYKRLGSSMDYRRERFTMDADYARAVTAVFVQLHERGLIYRDNRLVNWSWKLRTAISDLEVEHREADDTLYHVRYDVEGGDEIVIATVRPVTILADAAVAVNPRDERWRHLIGRTAIVPLVNRRVPIIADERVELDFGTGGLKVTPGHDPVDFEIGRDHGLETYLFMTETGTLTELRPDWAGLSLQEGEARAVAELRETGRLVREEPYRHAVGYCQRSGERIEPLVSLQWYCRMDSLAAKAIDAVRSERVTFHPRRLEKIFFDWMEAIRPWCISRQLWWGHRLPVWFAPDGTYVVQAEPPEGDGWEQSTDVLDTWFSSALWPYATLGWPERTPSLERWYPGNVLVTGRDIINLWVARMIFTGLEFVDDIPFTDVYINSTIQAADGRRMSKSLGTGVDPLDLIDRYGADATRYGLLKMCSTQDVRFAEGMIDEGRGFANKLWNASRLVLTGAAGDALPAPVADEPIDRWILTRLHATITEVTALYETYAFSSATKTLYAFVWNDFCDWYLEALKIRLYGDDEAAKRGASATALFVLERILLLLHPVMPFVTEEIWPFLPGARGLLMRAAFPGAGDVPVDADAERAVSGVVTLVTELRRMRQDAGLGPREPLDVAVGTGADADLLRSQAALLAGLGRAVLVDAAAGGVPVEVGDARVMVGGGALAGALIGKLERRLAEARAEQRKAAGKLANAAFVDRAPAAVVIEERERAERFGREADGLESKLAELRGA